MVKTGSPLRARMSGIKRPITILPLIPVRADITRIQQVAILPPQQCLLQHPTSNSANYGGGENAVGSTTVVGSYSGAPSPYGTFDQGGNVLEWTDSIPEESNRAVRGGSYNASLNQSRCAVHDVRPLTKLSRKTIATIGFRISSLTTVNAVPTISDAANQATNEDTATGAVGGDVGG